MGVLAYLVLVDAPFYIRGIWYVVKPFIDVVTAAKVKFVTGEAQRVQLLSPLIDEDQAMPFLLPNGKLASSVDTMHFLRMFHFIVIMKIIGSSTTKISFISEKKHINIILCGHDFIFLIKSLLYALHAGV